MWVKICGNTRLEDCQRAAELGADAVGFVFAEGKRTVTPEDVAIITAQLPTGLEAIGVFNTGSPAAIARAVEKAHLSGVQLHNRYDPYLIQRMRAYLEDRARPRVLQVVLWRVDEPAEQQAQAVAKAIRTIQVDGLADAVLLDACTADASGGTGRRLDWKAAAGVVRGTTMPVILAGGLRPDNVADAIQRVWPAGVDVSSGVELAPGHKDAEAVAAFIAQAHQAGAAFHR